MMDNNFILLPNGEYEIAKAKNGYVLSNIGQAKNALHKTGKFLRIFKDGRCAIEDKLTIWDDELDILASWASAYDGTISKDGFSWTINYQGMKLFLYIEEKVFNGRFQRRIYGEFMNRQYDISEVILFWKAEEMIIKAFKIDFDPIKKLAFMPAEFFWIQW